MPELSREVQRLLVELAFVAGNHRLLAEIPAFVRAIPLLVEDEPDRQICLAHLYLRSGDTTQALACLGQREDPAAALMSVLIATLGTPAPGGRIVNPPKPTSH